MRVSRRFGDPDWAQHGGPEYNALALLSPHEASRVWQAPLGRALWTPRTFARFTLLVSPLCLIAPTVWFVADATGWGRGGRWVSELVAHVVIGMATHQYFSRASAEIFRPFVAQQLLAKYG